MRPLLLIALVLLVGLGGCRKATETVVHGTITHKYTQQPVANIKVRIAEINGGGHTFIDSVYTDTEGYYSCVFFADEDFDYLPTPVSDGLFSNPNYNYAIIGETTRNDFVFAPFRHLKVHVVNTNPDSEWDRIVVGSGEPHYCSHSFNGSGMDQDDYFYRSSPSAEYHLCWRVSKYGSSNYFGDTIALDMLDTTYYTVSY